MNKWVEEQISPETLPIGKNDKTEAVLLREDYEKAGFFGKDNNPRKNRRQQEREEKI